MYYLINDIMIALFKAYNASARSLDLSFTQ